MHSTIKPTNTLTARASLLPLHLHRGRPHQHWQYAPHWYCSTCTVANTTNNQVYEDFRNSTVDAFRSRYCWWRAVLCTHAFACTCTRTCKHSHTHSHTLLVTCSALMLLPVRAPVHADTLTHTQSYTHCWWRAVQYTHVCLYARAHAKTHTHTHTHSHMHTLLVVCTARMLACTRTRTHKHTLSSKWRAVHFHPLTAKLDMYTHRHSTRTHTPPPFPPYLPLQQDVLLHLITHERPCCDADLYLHQFPPFSPSDRMDSSIASFVTLRNAVIERSVRRNRQLLGEPGFLIVQVRELCVCVCVVVLCATSQVFVYIFVHAYANVECGCVCIKITLPIAVHDGTLIHIKTSTHTHFSLSYAHSVICTIWCLNSPCLPPMHPCRSCSKLHSQIYAYKHARARTRTPYIRTHSHKHTNIHTHSHTHTHTHM